VLPNVLKAANPPIPFRTITQTAEQIVVVFPGAFYCVVNSGSNCSEEMNFGMIDVSHEEFHQLCMGMAGCNCNVRFATLCPIFNLPKKSMAKSSVARITDSPIQPDASVAGDTQNTNAGDSLLSGQSNVH
jgi:hypothetical protein